MPSVRNPTMIAVAVSFRDGLRHVGNQRQAFTAALNVYRDMHPEEPVSEAQEKVAVLIAQAGEEFGPWLYGREERPDPRTLKLPAD